MEKESIRLVAVADLHGKVDRLEWLYRAVIDNQADIAVLAGDLGSRRTCRSVLKVLTSLPVPVLLVGGNCDGWMRTPRFQPSASLIDLHLQQKQILGIPFVGLKGAVPIPFHAKAAWREKQLLSIIEPFLSSESILVAHVPPRGSCDRVVGRFHAGSGALARLVDSFQPRLVICGHIHEDTSVVKRGRTYVVNCSMGRGGRGVLIDLVKGVDEVLVKLL